MPDKIEVERVAMRREYDPFMEIEKVMCVFPDDRVNLGRLCYVVMWFDGHGTAWFEPYGECSYGYYLSTKPLHDMEMVDRCIKALEARYSTEAEPVKFKFIQKITRRR